MPRTTVSAINEYLHHKYIQQEKGILFSTFRDWGEGEPEGVVVLGEGAGKKSCSVQHQPICLRLPEHLSGTGKALICAVLVPSPNTSHGPC